MKSILLPLNTTWHGSTDEIYCKTRFGKSQYYKHETIYFVNSLTNSIY